MILYYLRLKCCKVTWVNFIIFQKYLSLRNCAMHPVLFTSNIVLFKGHTEMRGVRVCNLEIFYIFCFGR